MNTPSLSKARKSRQKMLAARRASDAAAAAYRSQIRETVDELTSAGMSVRSIAAELSITEGSLRALLRPEGEARRSRS